MSVFRYLPVVVLATVGACGLSGELREEPGERDLPLGEMPDIKADGDWGHATTCKPIPQLDHLIDPEITISLDGLTLRLRDRASSFSRVYPVGVGSIDDDPASLTFRESLSLYPLLSTGQKTFTIDTSAVDPCRIWWKSSDTDELLPVFAGLPFLRFWGAYAIHGPVTGYTLPGGGKLKRGYVSHGCVRMEAADVAELWALIKGTPLVPVRLQKELERAPDGRAVDLDQRWILSECATDADCNFAGGFCKDNAASGRRFCSAPCERYCYYDRFGYPVTFCVADENDPGSSHGFCTYRASDFNYDCRRYGGFVKAPATPRFGEPEVQHDSCVPGTEGWIGDRCAVDSDCMAGLSCEKSIGAVGFCSQPCSLYCPDLEGYSGTFCVDGLCRRRCDLESNGSSCPVGFGCSTKPRHNQPWVLRPACMPK